MGNGQTSAHTQRKLVNVIAEVSQNRDAFHTNLGDKNVVIFYGHSIKRSIILSRSMKEAKEKYLLEMQFLFDVA